MRKCGAKIKHKLVLNPLGMKDSIRMEMPTHAALLAIDNNVATESHLAVLYALADMAARMSDKPHIKAHSASVIRMVNHIYSADMQCGNMTKESLRISANLLIDWISKQPNHLISTSARKAVYDISARMI